MAEHTPGPWWDREALVQELSEERHRATVMTRANDDKKQEIHSLKQQNAELLEVLEGASRLHASYKRNKTILLDALKKSKLPISWLNAWDTQLQRCTDAVAKAKGGSDAS